MPTRSAPVVATKLHVPEPRPAAVARPRLLDALRAAKHARLVLVSAPAGFGKTTVLTQWLRSQDGRWRGCRWTPRTTTYAGSWRTSSQRCD